MERGNHSNKTLLKRRTVMGKKSLFRFFILLSCCMGFMLIVTGAHAAVKVYQWKWYTPYTLTLSPTVDQLPKLIEQRTNGQVKVKLYVGGEHPFQGPDMPRAIKTGSCHMADILGAYCVGIDPLLGASDLPFFPNSAEEEDALIAEVLKDNYTKFYNEYDMMPLASYPFPGQAITANVPLKDFDSFKGKKIRIFNKTSADMIATLGGSPVTIPVAEVYSSLQRGVVDGASASTFGQVASKFVEVSKYLTRTHAYGQGNTWTVVVSRKAFQELPSELQKKVLDAAAEYQALARQKQHDLDAWAVKEAVDRYGTIVTSITPAFREQIREKMKKGCWEKWAESTPGGMELLARMEEFHKAWVKKTAK
jgi:TRAP-type transport system periplasmic protein